MKAMVYRQYGEPHDVLKCEEVEKPVPKDDEVLIRIHAASVNPLDSHMMTTVIGRILRALRRQSYSVPGVDVAGVVEAVGRGVTKFVPGDAVFGGCRGAFAEYACTPEKLLTAKPASVTFEQAAALPVAGLTALQGLRNAGKLVAGQSVLINGASGGVGTFAVQIAKTYGADVTAVCSTRNVGLVRDIGADTVIDYTLADFTRRGEHYDLIFDLADNHPLSDYRRVLTPKGIYVGAGMLGKGPPTIGLLPGILLGMITKLLLAPFISQKLPSFMAKVNEKDLAILGELVAAAKITPLIDRSFKLAATADAIQYVREKRARGKVVITVLDA